MDKKIDIWSSGIIMYEILTKGGHPELGLDFLNDLKMSLEDFKEKMLKVDYNYDLSDKFVNLPKNASSLLQSMLNINPNLRYGSSTAWKHPWITRDEDGIVPLNMYQEMQLSMNAYESLKHVQKIVYALNVIKHNYEKSSNSHKCKSKYYRVNTQPVNISVENFSDTDEDKIFKTNSRSLNSSGENSLRSQTKQTDNTHLSFLQSGRGIGSVTAK